ncbi:MAG TPA: DUF285 domain-containing protein [Candidatus Mailhella merdavium]|nr:DUF285 domain-containing protein [Candidatus Mailhella merdavium]
MNEYGKKTSTKIRLQGFWINQPLNNWDVSSVRNMKEMFSYALCFNQPLNDWDVSNVENRAMMFNGAERFDQPLDRWDVPDAGATV